MPSVELSGQSPVRGPGLLAGPRQLTTRGLEQGQSKLITESRADWPEPEWGQGEDRA